MPHSWLSIPLPNHKPILQLVIFRINYLIFKLIKKNPRIISLGKRELVAYFHMPSRCHVYSCQCYVFLSHGAVSWSTLCDCGIHRSRGGKGSGPPEIGFPSNNGPENS